MVLNMARARLLQAHHMTPKRGILGKMYDGYMHIARGVGNRAVVFGERLGGDRVYKSPAYRQVTKTLYQHGIDHHHVPGLWRFFDDCLSGKHQINGKPLINFRKEDINSGLEKTGQFFREIFEKSSLAHQDHFQVVLTVRLIDRMIERDVFDNVADIPGELQKKPKQVVYDFVDKYLKFLDGTKQIDSMVKEVFTHLLFSEQVKKFFDVKDPKTLLNLKQLELDLTDFVFIPTKFEGLEIQRLKPNRFTDRKTLNQAKKMCLEFLGQNFVKQASSVA